MAEEETSQPQPQRRPSAEQALPFRILRAIINPAEPLEGETLSRTGRAKRSDTKLTDQVSTAGVKWTVNVAPVLDDSRITPVPPAERASLTFTIGPTMQPLTDLHERLTAQVLAPSAAPGCAEKSTVIWISTDVVVRQTNAKGQPMKTFRPLFVCPPVYLKALAGRTIRAGRGLRGVVWDVMGSAPIVRPEHMRP